MWEKKECVEQSVCFTCWSIKACCCCNKACSWGGDRICCICWGVIICGLIIAIDTGTWRQNIGIKTHLKCFTDTWIFACKMKIALSASGYKFSGKRPSWEHDCACNRKLKQTIYKEIKRILCVERKAIERCVTSHFSISLVCVKKKTCQQHQIKTGRPKTLILLMFSCTIKKPSISVRAARDKEEDV